MSFTITPSRPVFRFVPFAQARQWVAGGGWIAQEKKDGVWRVQDFGPYTLAVEKMRDGTLWAHDIIRMGSHDLRQYPTRARMIELRAAVCNMAQTTPAIRLMPEFAGGEGLEAIIAAGGEGGVWKHADAPFGVNWVKSKRSETHDCVVLEKHPSKQSIRLGQFHRGQIIERGWCAVLGGGGMFGESPSRVSQLAVGEAVEIECYGITANDKFREPRFIRARTDKTAAECVIH